MLGFVEDMLFAKDKIWMESEKISYFTALEK